LTASLNNLPKYNIHHNHLLENITSPRICCSSSRCSRPVFLTRRAAARYRALVSIIPGRERFSWNLSF